ncbi:unnamed protein product [Paramecium octaurelia]|uniref:Uncharacterized protein n=1 Tax=Paramecium octaurelia TaxID=43137 RepID=A0A8S1WPF3_PAROT|nr:unnamed protein product [Paramecium octaurelia]
MISRKGFKLQTLIYKINSQLSNKKLNPQSLQFYTSDLIREELLKIQLIQTVLSDAIHWMVEIITTLNQKFIMREIDKYIRIQVSKKGTQR